MAGMSKFRTVRRAAAKIWWMGMTLTFFLLVAPVIAMDTATTESTALKDDNLDFGMVEWISTLPGGFFLSSHQELRRISGEILGVVATAPIKKDTLLLRVPWEAIVNSHEPLAKTLAEQNAKEAREENTPLRCGTVRNLLKEWIRTDGKSPYAPYIEYLKHQAKGQIPSAWTKEGRDLFHIVIGYDPEKPNVKQDLPPVQPTSWLDDDWYTDCAGDPTDDLASHVAMIVLQRADDDYMVPIYDMYNHRNGPLYYNTKTTETAQEGYLMYASRDIEAGEQLHNSYNLCAMCGGRKNGYGTPEIVRDYGFVELFPQRWNLGPVFFDLNEDPNTGEVSVDWVRSIKGIDKAATLEGLHGQFDRLDELDNYVFGDIEYEPEDDDEDFEKKKASRKPKNMPVNEWDTIWEFHDAATMAVGYAINELADRVEDMVILWDDDDDDDDDDTVGTEL